MKNNVIMIFSFMVFFGFNSIAQNAGTQTSASGGQQGNKNMQGSKNAWKPDKESEFVKEAAYGSMMEVLLGNMAKDKGVSQQVKDFGSLMVKNHTDASNKLKTAVKNMQVTVPTTLDKNHQDKIDKVKDKTGKNFDKEYIDLMVKDHKKDVSDFEDAQKNVADPALKRWIDNTLPVLRQHLTKAQSIQSQLK